MVCLAASSLNWPRSCWSRVDSDYYNIKHHFTPCLHNKNNGSQHYLTLLGDAALTTTIYRDHQPYIHAHNITDQSCLVSLSIIVSELQLILFLTFLHQYLHSNTAEEWVEEAAGNLLQLG